VPKLSVMLSGAEFFGDDKPKAPSESKREAFFADFGERAKAVAGPMAIMLTGGIRTRNGMADIISSGTADLIGLGRPSAMEPDLPHKLLGAAVLPDAADLQDPSIPDNEARAVQYEIQGTKTWRKVVPTRLVGSGVAFLYHACAITSFGASSSVLRPILKRSATELIRCSTRPRAQPEGQLPHCGAARIRSAMASLARHVPARPCCRVCATGSRSTRRCIDSATQRNLGSREIS